MNPDSFSYITITEDLRNFFSSKPNILLIINIDVSSISKPSLANFFSIMLFIYIGYINIIMQTKNMKNMIEKYDGSEVPLAAH